MTALVEIVGATVELISVGPGRRRGLCPFHAEKTASFYVYDDHFHCFGCGSHGDVYDFLKLTRGLSYPQARAFLGIDSPQATAATLREARRKRAERAKAEWRTRDLIRTLGILVRVGRKALRALTPENLDQYGGVVDAVATWTRWHDVFVHGNDADRAALLQELQGFEVFDRGRLFNEKFDFRSWCSELLRREGAIKKPGANNTEPHYDANEWRIQIPTKRVESGSSQASAVQG